jgi:two-component system response regulator CssR
MKIYYVEDEKDISDIVTRYLSKEGYDVTVFGNGEAALLSIEDNVDLWILDIMLPGKVDGFEIFTKLKQTHPNTPVIFTSARDEEFDRVKGLELGSDDYITKPFSPKELVLRVKAVLRRNLSNTDILEYKDYKISIETRKAMINDEVIKLTSKEFDMVLLFIRNINQIIERQQILTTIWGADYDGTDRVIDDLLRRVRIKLSQLRVETLYGLGYRLF